MPSTPARSSGSRRGAPVERRAPAHLWAPLWISSSRSGVISGLRNSGHSPTKSATGSHGSGSDWKTRRRGQPGKEFPDHRRRRSPLLRSREQVRPVQSSHTERTDRGHQSLRPDFNLPLSRGRSCRRSRAHRPPRIYQRALPPGERSPQVHHGEGLLRLMGRAPRIARNAGASARSRLRL